jgi:hypothetical protein
VPRSAVSSTFGRHKPARATSRVAAADSLPRHARFGVPTRNSRHTATRQIENARADRMGRHCPPMIVHFARLTENPRTIFPRRPHLFRTDTPIRGPGLSST